MDTYSYISENGVIREIADLAARTKNAEQDLQINEVTLKTNRLAGYSESETQIGTWIDGKPVYRRVLVSTAAFTMTMSWSDFCYYCGSPVLNIDVLVHAEFVLERGVYIWKNNKNSIYIARQTSARDVPVGSMMIVEYTKV